METETAELTVAGQDYLKAIHALESADARVTTSALATRMGVARPLRVTVAPFGGPITVRTSAGHTAISAELARSIDTQAA